MTAAEAMPPELALDEPPLTDTDLAVYFGDAEALAVEASLDFDAAAELLREAATDSPVHAAARWRIEADDQAEWAMRKLLVAEDEMRQLIAQRDEYVARIDAWLERCAKASARTVGYMTERLEDYGVRRREAGGSPTLHLPSGSVKTSSSRPAADVDDDDVVATWLETIDGRLPAEQAAKWAAAMDDAELTLDDVVQRKAKVYVGKFRKLVHVAERVVGSIVTTTLRCGHTITTTTTEVDAEGDHAVGELIPCTLCEPDPIEGPVSQPVASVEVEPATEPVVVGPDDEPIPGAVVKPGGIKPTVVPGG